MPINVEPFTIPPAGRDTVEITIEETYEVNGVGSDTVTLRGTLIADRGAPLLGEDSVDHTWETSTVVARFVSLDVRGDSDVFGPVRVTLTPKGNSFGSVAGGKCKAALAVTVSMPAQKLKLRTKEPVQLRSTVTTVPPIGDERTTSVHPVRLLHARTGRDVGSLESARVIWRELVAQVAHHPG